MSDTTKEILSLMIEKLRSDVAKDLEIHKNSIKELVREENQKTRDLLHHHEIDRLRTP